MAKVIDKGLAPPDHPIYSGGPEVFSPRAFRPSSTSSVPATAGETPAESSSATGPDLMQPAVDAIEDWGRRAFRGRRDTSLGEPGGK